MYSFKNDYAEGAHPRVLEKLVTFNISQQNGYGDDNYSIMAKTLLKKKINNSEASIFFVSGGTQANLLVISHLLRPHEAVISALTGHIFANETGAIEATGHRVITVSTDDGKLIPTHISTTMKTYAMRPHVVKPKMVYISNSTELGTIYSKNELIKLYECCRKHELYLFMDGARLGYALTAESNTIDLTDLAKYTDVFYIGGTKNGALIGEAIVFNHMEIASDFDYSVKQKGALLAKGRLLGLQFLSLFEDNLYFEIAAHANKMAKKISRSILECGYNFLSPPVSNQSFPILPKDIISELSNSFEFYIWKNINEKYDAVRIITSWATEERYVDEFCRQIAKISKTN
ncbi:threonine aldolase family protein [Sphingobacterium sp. LRF_L2]|uniref:threonine aldolase family protein n=1 Tax=Sphingobacterium sp. LRF_L2 TaxID=3369421 RepID=UPI003F62BFA7